MANKRARPENIITKLRQVEDLFEHPIRNRCRNLLNRNNAAQ